MTLRKIRWYSVKNLDVLPSRWAMWDWLSWTKTRKLFIALHACITYLRVRLDVDVENYYDPTKTTMDRIRLISRGNECGPNPWQKHHDKARDALRSATKGDRKFTSICDPSSMLTSTLLDRWMGKILRLRLALWHQPECTFLAEGAILHDDSLGSFDTNKQAGPLWQRLGFKEATRGIFKLLKGKECCFFLWILNVKIFWNG